MMDEFRLDTDYSIHKGTMEEVKDYIKKPYTSPTLDEQKDKVSKQVSKSVFSISDIDKETKDADFNDVTEEKINKELEELGEDDFKDMASLLIAGTDWILEKILNNFFNREQIKETPAQEQKLQRLKIIGGKIMAKHAVKFKLEMLFLFMFIGYATNRYATAKIITPKSNDNIKKNRREFVKKTKGDRIRRATVIDIAEKRPIKPEIKQEFKPEIKQEFEPEIKQEFEPEIKQEFEPEIKQESEPEIKQEKPEIGKRLIDMFD